jgi:hypothetical protein
VTKKAILTVVFFFLFANTISHKPALAADSLTINPTDDVSLTNLYPDETTGSLTVLRISYTEGNDNQHLAFFNFDLSEIPNIAKIESADLILAQKPETDDKDVPFSAMLLQEDWDKTTITWNTRPKIVGNKFPIAVEEFMLGGRGYTRFNLTDLVQEWVKNNVSTYGFQMEGPKNFSYQKIFLSSNTNIAPKLEIDYSIFPGMVDGTAVLPDGTLIQSDETGDSANTSGTVDTQEEEIPKRDEREPSKEGILAKSLAEVLTPNNFKIAAGAIFFLILLKILVSKRV